MFPLPTPSAEVCALEIEEIATNPRFQLSLIDKFAEEARKIHFGEVDPHGIYGEASREEVASLLEDGIDVMPLPQLPEERN
mgnify:CR=1 FL=1